MEISKAKKNLICRRILLGAVILILSLIQNGAGGFLKIGSVGPLLLIPAVVAAGMYEGEISGVFYGLFAGALWDLFAKGNNFNAIFLVFVGYVCALLIQTIMRNNFVTHLLLSSAFTVIYCAGYWLYHFVLTDLDSAFVTLLKFYLPMAIFTCILSTPVFLLIRFIERRLPTSQYFDE